MSDPRPGEDGRGLGRQEAIEPLRLHRFFERSVRRDPAAVALLHGETVVTYGELNAMAEAVAGAIAASGARPGDTVALAIDRGIPMIAAILGCLKGDYVYAAIDTAFPEARIRLVLEDCRPAAVIAGPQWPAGLRPGGVPLLPADPVASPGGSPPPGPEPLSDELDAPVYVIHTSGTTGRPKGIVQTHRALSNLIQWQNRATGIDFSGTVLQFSSFGFDVHLQEIFSTFAAGGRLCLVDQPDRIDPDRLIALLARHHVSVMFLPVSVLSALFADPARLPDSLRDIITAGEPLILSPAMKNRLRAGRSLRIHNHYGVSESHVVTALTLGGGGPEGGDGDADPLPDRPSIGRPVANCRVAVLDAAGAPAASGETGEIWIAGACLARGYLNRPEEERRAFHEIDGVRWYRTGDFARWEPDGTLAFQGRRDDQVKISGHLVVLSEVEAILRQHPAIADAAVVADETGAERRLVAHAVRRDAVTLETLRAHMASGLPEFMVPALFLFHETLPTGPTGKIDRRALSAPRLDRSLMPRPFSPPATPLERTVLDSIEGIAGLAGIGMDDGLAQIGFGSLSMVRAAADLTARLCRPVSPLAFFEFPTPRLLAAGLGAGPAATSVRRAGVGRIAGEPVAIVGWAGLFPGAGDVAEMWRKILASADMLTDLAPEDCRCGALVPGGGQRILKAGTVAGAEYFDARLFGLSHQDALWMDPQQRKFLEVAWACLEDGCLDPGRFDGRIGVFAGMAEPAYLFNLRGQIGTMMDYLAAVVAADKDFIASRAAYHLGLTGPAVTVQSACSTGLLAVHQACEALRAGACEVALAGAASLLLPQETGTPFAAESIFSPDGVTRPFDIARAGTNLTNAVAAVLLKPLSAALADRDAIRAVILGSAANNDGARKAGFTAPSVAGQRDAIAGALAAAGVEPADLDFIETHGTATRLGDQVELGALREVFAAGRVPAVTCALSSVKSHLGHTNRAAGLVGLIAAARAVESRVLPGLRHFTAPDPALEINGSPFTLSASPRPLSADRPLRAGVSSLGVGGTNVHVVLGSAPAPSPRTLPGGPQLLTLSAATPGALSALAGRLADHLERVPDEPADVAWSLARGRQALAVRAHVVAAGVTDMRQRLRALAGRPPSGDGQAAPAPPRIALLFPGSGPEHVAMGRGLFRLDPTFRETVEEGCRVLSDRLGGADMLSTFREGVPAPGFGRAEVFQALLLIVEVATARALAAMGVVPHAMLGLSGGEFACATLAGCLEFGDAVRLVSERGRLMDEVAATGVMVGLLADADQARAYCGDEVFIAGRNSRRHTLLGGTAPAMEVVIARLEKDGVDFRRLPNRNPNHTPLMEGMVPGLRRAFEGIALSPPARPFVSSVTGRPIEAAQATDPGYWCTHLSHPIAFADGLDTLAGLGCTLFLEAGPRETLCQLGRAHFPGRPDGTFVAAMGETAEAEPRTFLEALGAVWSAGGPLDRDRLAASGPGRARPLPAYPFEGRRYWLEERAGEVSFASSSSRPSGALPLGLPRGQWLQERALVETRPLRPADDRGLAGRWAIPGGHPAAAVLAARLRAAGAAVTRSPAGADRLVLIAAADPRDPSVAETGRRLCATVALLRGMAQRGEAPCQAWLVTIGGTRPDPAFATLAEVLPLEHSGLSCRHLLFADDKGPWLEQLTDALASPGEDDGAVVLHEGRRRRVERFRPLPAPGEEDAGAVRVLPAGGVYLLTGGLGQVGGLLTGALIRRAREQGTRVRLALVGRRNRDLVRDRLAALDRAGAEVLYVEAGARGQGVGRAVRACLRQWGGIDAVLHLAADLMGEDFLRFAFDLDAGTIARQCRPKLEGVAALDRALEAAGPGNRKAPPARIAFSSVAVLLGGIGYGAYSFANRRLTEVCQRRPGWTVIHWDVFAAGADSPEGNRATDGRIALGSSVGDGPRLTGEDALGAIDRVLAAGLAEAAVVTMDPAARLARAAADRSPTLSGVSPSRQIAPTAALVSPALVPPALVLPALVLPGRPAGALEGAILRSWRRRLAVEDLPADANFLAFGGDSLTAVRVALDLRQDLGLPVPPSLLLRNPRLPEFRAALAELAGAAVTGAAVTGADLVGTGAGTADPPPSRDIVADADQSFPASPLQVRWYHMHPEGYGHLIMPVLLSGPVDFNRLRPAIIAGVRRFVALRTVYSQDGGNVRGHVLPEDSLPEPVLLDFSTGSAASRAARLHDWAEALEDRRLDIHRTPPLGLYLLRLAGDRALFVLHTHHICFDGWSASLLWDSIAAAYLEAPLPPVADYRDLARWCWRYLDGPEAGRLRDRWRTALAGAPPPCRPTPDLAGDPDDPIGEKIALALDPATVEALRRRARALGGTLFSLLMAAFALMLARAGGGRDLLFGTTGAGRAAPGADDAVGVFVNPLPVRLSLAGVATVADLAARVGDLLDLFQSSQSYPLLDMLTHVPALEGKGFNDAFLSYLLYQNYRKPAPMPGFEVTMGEADDEAADPQDPLAAFSARHARLMRSFEVIVFDRADGGLSVNVWYRRALYSRSRALALAGLMEKALLFLARTGDGADPRRFLEETPRGETAGRSPPGRISGRSPGADGAVSGSRATTTIFSQDDR